MTATVRASNDPTTRATAVAARGDLLPMLGIGAQLLVLAVVARMLHIESPAFAQVVLPLALAGWLVHHLLPAAWRLSFFAVLSAAAVLLVFRWSGVWILGIGAGLIAIARAPVAHGMRVGALLAVVAVLAAWRAGAGTSPIPGVVWPILGSMFMFRLIAYMYDARHAKTRPTLSQTAAYFFALPNVVFPLFPVIDFATFRRTWYDRPPTVIYQQGVDWIARGFTHLILYRLVYQYGTISPADVGSLGDLVRYILANFALYLRVSGQFHLIVGMLHLFGFRLPETHHFFFLASSFTDFWRRINIYWKEFMQKVVFTPAYLPLRRRWGDTAALVTATLAVFVATWFFHSYQWFWLLGTWLWSVTDTLFWGILAVLLVVNVLREARLGRERAMAARPFTLASAVALGSRTAATFAALALLWTLWTSPTLADFVTLLRVETIDAPGVALAAGTLIGVALAGIATNRWKLKQHAAASLFRPQTLTLITALALVWIAGEGRVARHLPLALRAPVRDVRLAELNREDAARLQRGYYENIVGVNRFNGPLWELYAQRTAEGRRSLTDLGILRDTHDERQTELVPLSGGLFGGVPMRINSWGMRDQEYPPMPAPGTYRVALLGQSYVMGMGVGDGEPFEALLESSLNSRARATGRRFEILNFAIPRYSLLQQLHLLRHGRALTSSPHAVLLVGHPIDLTRIPGYLQEELRRGGPIAPFLESRLDSAAVSAEMPFDEFQRRMKPYVYDLHRWVLAEMGREIRAAGALPVYAFIPMPLDQPDSARTELLEAAALAGFETIDLHDVYGPGDARLLTVAEWDRHPNPTGHRIIAERLELALEPILLNERPRILPAKQTTSAEGYRAGAPRDGSPAPTPESAGEGRH